MSVSPLHFTPKSVSIWREGYKLKDFKADALAGLTVAILALPLSMAIAIASGATPQSGIYASIIGGFIVSALGGSRYQIGGPAGAFIVTIHQTNIEFGYDGFLLATLLGGFLLALLGVLRLGSYIRYVPQSVIVGFTAAIALIIFASQINDLLGLKLNNEPSAFFPKLAALAKAAGQVDCLTLELSLAVIVAIVLFKTYLPTLPAFLLVVTAAAMLTLLFHLPVETIGSRFGGVPNHLPNPQIPPISIGKVIELLPAAITIALLGGVESLLSAVVADTMSGRKHRSNIELIAQGLANIVSPLFGGLSVTGTVARTAANIRAHAHSPMAGMLHSLFLLLFIVYAAPLANTVPLAALAAILAFVCWNMVDHHECITILRSDKSEAIVLIVTFSLTIIYGLTEGILVGVALSALIFMHTMARNVAIEIHTKAHVPSQSSSGNAIDATNHSNITIVSIDGPLFFGATKQLAEAFEFSDPGPHLYILNMKKITLIDASGLRLLQDFMQTLRNKGNRLILCEASKFIAAQLTKLEYQSNFDPQADLANILAAINNSSEFKQFRGHP